jgi:hypothetical protein
VVARVGSCCARVGLCRASVADVIRGPLARMHCGCVFVRIRCEGQPQGRCLSRVSCVRRSAVLGADPACLSSPHIRHSIIYSERAAPRKGRSVRSQSPEGTENYRSYKTGAATLFTLVLLTRRAPASASSICSLFFTNGRRVGAIPTCSHVRCVGLSGDGPALVPRGRRVFLIPPTHPCDVRNGHNRHTTWPQPPHNSKTWPQPPHNNKTWPQPPHNNKTWPQPPQNMI